MATVRVNPGVALLAAAIAMLAGTLSLPMMVEGADQQQLVTNLPQAPAGLGFDQYAGYVTVNETHGRALFYWLFTADHPNATSLPLAVWFNGGPGGSSVGTGLLKELGPFHFRVGQDNVSTMYLNNHTWIKEANILFLETPVAVGYSYSNTSSDYSNSSSGVFSDTVTAEDNLQFLLKWFEKFPEYKANEFYLIGESYAGHYIPTLARNIVNYNDAQGPNGSRINFIGYAIGNPLTDAYYNNLGSADWWHSHDLISDETHAALINTCTPGEDWQVFEGDSNPVCINASTDAYIDAFLYLDPYNIHAPFCTGIPVNNTGVDSQSYNPACAPDPIVPYLNSADVQRALHIETPIVWNGPLSNVVINSSTGIINYSRAERLQSMLPIHKEMISRGLRIWIFSGDLDASAPTTTARYAINSLGLEILTSWYPWQYDTQVAGYTEIYKGLTFATVRGAGHMVPQDQPERSLSMFRHFLAGDALPKFPLST